MEKAYTVKEIAKILGVSYRTVIRRIEDGDLEAFKATTVPKPQYYILESSFGHFIATKQHLPEVRRYSEQLKKQAVEKLDELRRKPT
ncbi:MAG TPA: helix-turn-helix domain-containing protein [bacterium]|nr:helix-turn-helix domain-containing protein [bacterium]HPO52604.1 helix-turn-helix domain-containing protein [bacterium]